MTQRRSSKEYNDDIDNLQSTYSSLAEGVSLAGELCPSCGGGSSKEGSLSITRESGRLLFHCHRASCEFSGIATPKGGRYLHAPAQQPERRDGRRSYDSLDKGPLPDAIANKLHADYSIGPRMCARGLLRWTTTHSPRDFGRVVLPVANPAGEVYGYVARKTDDQTGPKTLSMFASNEGAWYPCNASKDLIVVEDQLSAIRASEYINAVALLGTNITDQTLRNIKMGNYREVFLALDPDAFPKSIRLARTHRATVRMTVVHLPKDIKNMRELELVDWLHKSGVAFYD